MNEYKKRRAAARFDEGRLTQTAFAAMTLAMFGSSVQAQSVPAAGSAPEESSQVVEMITVTGSRVRSSQATASSPITTLDSAALELSGSPSPENLLNRLPQVAPADNASSNRGEGIATVDLRALGPSRTLVLVNGRRFAPANGLGVVDLNSIPTSMIERAEVVTGGASAVYGSDALAGVVNFILKDDFEGMSLRSQIGATQEGDGQTALVEALFGSRIADDRGSVLFSASYYDRQPVRAADRDRYSVSINGGSATAPAGRIDNVGLNPNPQARAVLGGTSTARDYAFNANGIEPFVNALPGANPDGDRYNFTDKEYLQIPQTRISLSGLAKLELGAGVETFLEAFYSDSRVEMRQGESPLTNARLAPDNPLLPQSARDMLAMRPDPTAPAIFQRRLSELGPRWQQRDTDTYQVNLGLKGELGQDWTWELVYGYGRTEQQNTILGGASKSRIEASLLGCPSGTVQLLGCRLIDFFGPNKLTADDIGYIRVDAAQDVLEFARNDVSATTSGSLFALPAGDVKVALGAEYREDKFKFTPDDIKIRGDLAGFDRSSPTRGDYDVKEVFGELVVPILTGLPAAEELGIELGGRYSDYSSVGSVLTYKAGANWRPMRDVRLRVMYQRAIRAPSVFELFQGGDTVAVTFRDPCATVLATGASAAPPSAETAAICQLQGLADPRTSGFTQVSRTLDVTFLGNEALQEETSNTWTAGLVVTPGFAPDLQLSVDFFRIEIDDYINRAFGGIAGTINTCFASGVTTAAGYDADPACRLLYRTGSGELRSSLPLANVQTLETRGVDVQLSQGFDLLFGASDWGRLSLSASVTYVDSYETLDKDYVGLVSQDFGAMPQLRSYVDLGWRIGRTDARLGWQHIASMKEELSGTAIPSTDYFNLTGSFELTGTVNLFGGINNLLDEQAPLFPNQIQNTDTSLYDVIGRYYFLGANVRF